MLLAHLFLNSFFWQDFAVIIDLLDYKNINVGTITCCDTKVNIFMHKIFNKNKKRISCGNVSRFTIPPHSYHKVGVIVDTSCEAWKNIFNSADNQAFKNPFSWMFITKNVTETSKILSQQRIELDSDVTLIIKEEKSYALYEVFYTGFNRNGRYVERKIGHWNNSLYISQKNRRDLKGLVLKSTVVIAQSQKVANKTFVRFLEEEEPGVNKVDPLHKFKLFAAFRYLKDMFNVSYEFQRTSSWGYTTNGTFDGLVGALHRRESEIGGSPLFIRTDRSMAVDYAAAIWQTRPCFVFRHPKHSGGFYTIYTRPLTIRVWYCMMAMLAASTCILVFLLKLNTIKVPGDDEDSSFSLGFLCMWSALCQQGLSITRNSTSVKMVVFVIFLYNLTLYQYYNGTVVSTLLREPPKNIRTLQQLLRSDLKAGIEDILYTKDFFKVNPVALEFYNKKVAHTTPYNYFPAEKGIALVKKGGFAFFLDDAVAYRIMGHTFTEKELCELQEVMMFAPQHLGVAVAKNSPYRELIAYGIRKMDEAGIMSRLQSVWDAPRPACVRTPDSSVISVSLQEFSSAVIVLLLGYAVSIVILGWEILMWRLEKTRIEFRH